MKRPSFLRKWDGFRLQSKASISPPTILLVSDIIEMSPAFLGATNWGLNLSEMHSIFHCTTNSKDLKDMCARIKGCTTYFSILPTELVTHWMVYPVSSSIFFRIHTVLFWWTWSKRFTTIRVLNNYFHLPIHLDDEL